VALIPAMLYAVWPEIRRPLAANYSRLSGGMRVVCAVAASLAFLIVAAIGFRHILYLPDFRFGGSIGHFIVGQISKRMSDFGELLINAPEAKLGRFHPLIFGAGLILTVMIGIGLWRSRRDWHATHLYFMAYLAIMAVWPFGDARFWVPVLPLISLLVIQAIVPWNHLRIANWLTSVYLIFYGVAAVAALAYTTRITFAGPRFAELYGVESTRQAYQDAWSGKNIDPNNDWIFVIRRYGMPPPASR
jgi:hypothetical protein